MKKENHRCGNGDVDQGRHTECEIDGPLFGVGSRSKSYHVKLDTHFGLSSAEKVRELVAT